MNNQLNFNAVMAWTAFGAKDYSGLEKYGQEIYNYFVHYPAKILSLDTPLLIGKVFQACLGFQEPDEDIQEVRAENAFICFSQALISDKSNVHDEAAARLMILLIRDQKHLINQVQNACNNGNSNPYSFFNVISDGFPNDMPVATNTKMLFTAYYVYDSILDKANILNEFVNPIEKNAFINIRDHVIHYCNQLQNTTLERKVQLGKMVFDKILDKLQNDIKNYSDSL